MSFDNQFWSRSLETYTSLDADDRISYITVSADTISGTDFFYLLYGFYFIIKSFTVYSYNLTFCKFNLKCALFVTGDVFQIGLLGKSLCTVENLSATDTCSPDTYIIRILQFGKVGKESVLVQEVDFLFLRLSALSRVRVIISTPGAITRKVMSKRIWSLPAPVEPWAIASALICLA